MFVKTAGFANLPTGRAIGAVVAQLLYTNVQQNSLIFPALD
jgi:hypothetical protein